MNKGTVVGLRGKTAQDVIEKLHSEKDNYRAVMVLAENDKGEIMMIASTMFLRDQSFLVDFAHAKITHELVKSMRAP